MGLRGVIRERSCRWAADSRPMSCGDSQTFLQLGPVLCKGLRWVAMIHPSSRKGTSPWTNVGQRPALPGNIRGQPKACRATLKSSELRFFLFVYESQNSLGHWWVTCLVNASLFKWRPRSYNCSACRNNGHNQGCEMICMQFGLLQFTSLCHAQILS